MDLLSAVTTTTLAGTPEEAYRQVRELADKAEASRFNFFTMLGCSYEGYDQRQAEVASLAGTKGEAGRGFFGLP